MVYYLQEFLEGGAFQSFSVRFFSPLLHCNVKKIPPEVCFCLVQLFCTIKRVINRTGFTFLIKYFVAQLFFWRALNFSGNSPMSLTFSCFYWLSRLFFINSNHIQDFIIKSKLLLCTFVLFVASTNLHFINLGLGCFFFL